MSSVSACLGSAAGAPTADRAPEQKPAGRSGGPRHAVPDPEELLPAEPPAAEELPAVEVVLDTAEEAAAEAAEELTEEISEEAQELK